ncbi:MAG: hypothetical protein H6718_13585 [Polyangiaceae bacterium]|nr:hypothetical protein [Polyangiaceae bacterium]
MNGAVDAYRRPGALALVYAARLLAGWLVAAPIVAAINGSGLLSFPQGDASLFAPGGDSLVALVQTSYRFLGSAMRDSSWAFCLAAALGLLPYAFWLFALGHSGRLSLGEAAGQALQSLPRLVLLSALSLVLSGILAVLAAVTWGALYDPLVARVNERSVDLWRLASLLPFALLWLWLSMLTDLSRAAVVQHNARFRLSLRLAWRAFKAQKLVMLSSWLTPWLWGVALIAGAALIVERIAVEQPGGWRVLLAWLLHQLVIVGLLLLRASWYTRALRGVGAQPVE